MEEQQVPSAEARKAAPKSRTLWIAVAAVAVVVVVVVAAIFALGLFRPTETIKIGFAISLTGTLDDFGVPMRDAALLAQNEINAAGGVLGRPIAIVFRDDQTRPNGGANAAASLVYTEGVSVLIGSLSSGVSQAISTITLENNVVQISPASTSPLFSCFEIERAEELGIPAGEIPDKDVPGFFWRTAPSDALQGQVSAMLAESQTGWDNVGIIAVNNPYGKGFAGAFIQYFGGSVVAQVNYTEVQASYLSDLQLMANAGVDAVLLIGYPGDGITMMKEWWARRAQPGWGWDWFWSEGVKSAQFLTDLKAAGVDVTGIVGTAPISTGPGYDAFRAAYNSTYRDEQGDPREPEVFDQNAYDAVYLVALAIQKAGTTTSDGIRQNLQAVSGPPGTEFGPGEWADALAALRAGTDVNYQGASGLVDFDAAGEVASEYETWEITGSLSAGFQYLRTLVVPPEDLVTTVTC